MTMSGSVVTVTLHAVIDMSFTVPGFAADGGLHIPVLRLALFFFFFGGGVVARLRYFPVSFAARFAAFVTPPTPGAPLPDAYVTTTYMYL